MLSPHLSAPLAVAALCSAVVAGTTTTVAATAEKRAFHLPRGDAAITLKQFAATAGTPIVYLVDRVRGATTNAVDGDFAPREALERMLAGSGLESAQDAATGAFVVSRKRDTEEPPHTREVAPASDPQPKPKTSAMTSQSRTLLAALAGWLATASVVGAQSAPPSNEIVELTPFTVNSSRDVGYIADSTLAGSRLNTKLRDTPASVSVFTTEFLSDLGITDVSQLVTYSVNAEMDTEARVSGSFQNSIVNAQSLNGTVLIRGLTASQGTDYFTSISPIDSYRVGRFDESRGPNSILFGIGSPGGIINQTSKLASVHKDSASIRYSLGSWDRSRTEIDFNKVLKKQGLALSVSALQQENGGWREFDFKDKRRVFSSLTVRPNSRVTLNFSGETGRDISAITRSYGDSEEVLAWYDNRAALGVDAVTFTPTNVAPTAAQRAVGVTLQNGVRGGIVHRYTFIENSSTFFDAVGTFLSGTYNNAAVRAPDGTPGRTGGTLRIHDARIYPYSTNAAGPGMFRNQNLWNYTATADFEITPNLFLNVGHNHQYTKAVANVMVNASPVFRGDPNRTLGIGGAANPFAGKLYFDGDWRRDIHSRDYKETRVSLSYSFEPAPKWLGRHRLATLLSHTDDYDERANSWLVLAGRPFGAQASVVNNRVTVRNYVTEGDSGTYRVGDWRTLPTTLTADGRTFTTAYANDAAGGGTNGAGYQFTNSRLAVLQSHFLGDRLVTTLGYREDSAKITALGYRDDPIRGDVVDPDPVKQTANYFVGRTRSLGGVYHVASWVSLIGNYSTSVGIPSFNRTVFPNGNLAPAAVGKGSDYGLGFDLLNGKLNAKAVRFDSREDSSNGAYGAQATFTSRNQRIMDAFASALVGTGKPLTQSQWDPLYKSSTPPVSGSLADFQSSGYEARVTANFTPAWRLVLNYSYTDSTKKNLFSDAIPWYGVKPANGVLLAQGVSQTGVGQYVVDANAYEAGGTIAKWLELSRLAPGAAVGSLTTSANVTVAQELFNLVEEMNQLKQDQEKRWGLRPHKISLFTAYDLKEGFLRGVSVGGGWRWQSANIIGSDLSGKEITGKALSSTDLMLRYSRKFKGLTGKVSFQVNINNVLDNTAIIPVRLFTNDSTFTIPGGRGVGYGRYDLVDPREIRFTTSYAF